MVYNLPNATAVSVSRVGAGGGLSRIDGALTTGVNGGHVMILNPNGVLFGANAVVNVGSLTASTGHINDDAFMASDTAAIAITGATTGSITNLARPSASYPTAGITVAQTGLVALVAPSVVNSGVITATKGRIVLASAEEATLSLDGNNLYEIAVTKGFADGTITNSGTLAATGAGGTILLSALDVANALSGVINLNGVQQATRIEVNAGRVELKSDLDAATVTGISRTVNVCGCSADLQDAIDIAASGASVNIGAGTYVRTTTLNVNKTVTLSGAGESHTTIDASGVSGYGVLVTADGVSLSDFTLYGPAANAPSSYGIKVQPAGLPASSRLHDFSISHVTSRGAGRAELDLNGVIGATIDHFTANGAPVGNDSGTTAGAGIQITDSANVTITNSTTLNNAWGGVALFQTNKFFDQQTTNITVATSNSFAESNPLYLQDESASLNFGTLSLPGFSYAVRNPATVGSGSSLVDYSQFTWMQASAQGGFDLAVNLLKPDQSYVQGWNGTALTQNFQVGTGHLSAGGMRVMSIMAAVDAAQTGATIDIRPGDYVETAHGRQVDPAVNATYDLGLFLYKDNMTLRGVDASGNPITSADNVQAWITAGDATNFGMNHGVTGNNVTVQGLGFKPDADKANKTIEIAGDNFTFRNSVVDNRTADGGAGALYFGELLIASGKEIERLTVTGSKFLDGSVTLTNGVGVDSIGGSYQPAADRVISNNTFVGSADYTFGGVLLTGQMGEINWRTMPIGAATLTGNRFSGFDDSVLVRGDQQGVDLSQVMHDNTFDRSVLVTDAGGNVRGELYASTMGGPHDPIVMRPKYSIQSSIQAGITRSQAGDTINVGPEATAESVVLNVPRNLAFNGSTIGSLALTAAAAGAGLRGAVTASGPAGFAFNAPVRLLGPTSLTAAAGNIAFNDDVQGSFDLSLRASGDISLVTGGSETLPLGMLTVSSNDFNLSSTLWVSGYNIDASGSVALSGHTLRALGSLDNVISAGSSVTGSTISAGNVQISGGNVSTSVISLGNVTVVAVTVDGALTGSFIVINAQDAVTASVSATQDVSVSAGGVVNLSGSATNLIITAPSATANGNFKKVTNNSGGAVTVNGAPQPSGSVPSVQQVLPAKVVTGADASGGGPLPALAVAAGDPGKSKRRQLKDAADVLQNGEALEIDLSPSND
jgi:filamentous hemagglutinin family protein